MKSSEGALEERLSKLESETRRLRCVVDAAFLAFAGCALLAQARPQTERLFEAEKFVLRDGRGSARATLSVEERDGTATLAFLDEEGRIRLRIGSRRDGSGGLGIRDESGKLRLILSVTPAGEPAFVLRDERGTPRLGFALAQGGPGFRLYDAEGRRRVVLGVAPGGAAALRLYDSKERARADLRVTDDEPSFALTDESGGKVASLP